jgi:hypothetical protein
METSLAIYEALIQANVPSPAARRVAECLEKDMTSNLATKNDFLLLRQEIEHLSQSMATRFAALEARFDARFEAVDTRFNSIDARFEARFEAIDTQFVAVDSRFDALESRLSLTIQNMETRLMVKLGALMVVLFGLAGTLMKLLD